MQPLIKIIVIGFALTALIGLSTQPLLAQVGRRLPEPARGLPAKNIAKINVLSPFALTGSFFYERVLQERMSAQLGLFFTGVSFFGTRFGGFGLTPEVRYYVAGDAPRGLYIAPFYRFQRFNARIRNIADLARYSQNGGGVVIGRQWIIAELISLEGFIGGGYMSGKPTVIGQDGQQRDVNLGFFGEGPRLRAGLTAGFRF
jgi:hypothetical protein